MMTVGVALGLGLWSGTGNAYAPHEVACRVDLDRSVLPADATTRVIVKITLDAPVTERHERLPVNLGVVLDRSGSMGGEKIAKAREAAIEALRRLNGSDLFSVVIYDHEVETLVPAQAAGNTEWIENRIRGIEARGNTALFGGVSQGAAEVRRNADRKYVSRIILLSDGLANVGPSTPDDLARLGAALRKEGISVSTVGVGTDYNEDLMTQLAQKSDGNTYFVESSRDLPRIFAAELGDVLSVAARDVQVEIEFAGRPLRVIGREGRIRDNRVELDLSQLYGGQSKYVLVEVEVPSTAAGKEKDIASVRCQYRDTVREKTLLVTAHGTARFSADAAAVERSVSSAVSRDVVLNEAAEARDRAIALNDAGRNKDAAAELTLQATRLREMGYKYKMDDLVKEGIKLEGRAKAAEAAPMSSVDRKGLRTESFQTRNQQIAQ